MRLPAGAIVLAATFLLLAGCVGLPGAGIVCRAPGGDEIPQPPWLGMTSFPTAMQAWDHLLFEAPVPQLVEEEWEFVGHNVTTPPGWTLQVDALASGPTGDLLRLRAEPGEGATGGTLEWRRAYQRSERGGTCGTSLPATFELQPPADAPTARPGEGVLVRTAGFLDDGRLFYTNIAALDNTDWPRVEGYSWSGGDPLSVYVYDQDRSERPAYWSVGVHEQVAGEPVDQDAWSYSTTIRGFNEALKGLAVGTLRVTHFPGSDGYTTPGREDHWLYGHDLTFIIQVTAVHPTPCADARACLPL